MKIHKKYLDQGFTLIELLVVISIIGLLSSIVLASLNTTRVRAADAAIKADMRGIVTSAEIEYASLGNKYNTTGVAIGTRCDNLLVGNAADNTVFKNREIQNAIKHIKDLSGNGGTCTASADGSSYNVTASLKTPDSTIFINNKGVFREASSSPSPSPSPSGSGFGDFCAVFPYPNEYACPNVPSNPAYLPPNCIRTNEIFIPDYSVVRVCN